MISANNPIHGSGQDGRYRRAGNWAAVEGLPFPLGVTWIPEEQAYNFALYSKHADSVSLLIYQSHCMRDPVFRYAFDPLKNKSGRVWHCRISPEMMQGGMYYAYQVGGPLPKGRFEWHAFDPEKILLDPYAKAVYFPREMDRLAASRPGSNAARAPLGVIPKEIPRCSKPRAGAQHESDTVIYELHVGGFTKHSASGVTPRARGTYLGVIEKIPYLKELGVTVVELMPVFQFDPSDGNFWGYSPLSFFAPHNGYASDASVLTQHPEFCEMVDALHAADIEVVLDVVYNHTCEADHRGPVYSYKGIDNSTYYLISDQPARPYADFTGAGNTLHCANHAVRKMVMDSVRYWSSQMGVDGFRFDLASVFARTTDGSINVNDAALLGDLVSDPKLAALRLIVEPWDASGVYQLGRAFPGLTTSQWNSRFRDDVRRFVRGDPGMVPSLMRRIYGSDDLFPDDLMHAYRPCQSINYITSHDGFTLYDLVSFDRKRNWANGHGNTDGLEEEFSWNCGWEADEGVPQHVRDLRVRQVKNFCCLLFLANGTPLLRAGDEFMQTQGGNSNPYNQDNETTWLDWNKLQAHADVFRFFKLMIAFRKAHPSLARSRFWREDIMWYGVDAGPDLGHFSHSVAFALHGASQFDDDLYVMINGYWEPLDFVVQDSNGKPWRRVVDTSRASPFDFMEPGKEEMLPSVRYRLAGRSVAILIRS